MTNGFTTGVDDFVRFPHDPENVPAELLLGERFVCCDEWKVPTIAIPNGAIFAASSTDPDTWRDHGTAYATWKENEHVAGVGRVIADDEDYVGVDFDDVIDPETGEIMPWASYLIDKFSSYAEVSPSLTGIKVWIKAPDMTRAYKKPGLEIYPRGRYFTLTGLRLPGSPPTIEERGDVLAEVIAAEFPRVDRNSSSAANGYGGPCQVIDLADLLEKSGLEIFMEVSDGSADRKYAVRCPWSSEHSDGDLTGTYCGQYPSGALFFVCHHAHCAGRDWHAFRHYLESLVYLGRPPRGDRSFAKGRLR